MNRFGSHPNHENRPLYEGPRLRASLEARRAVSFFLTLAHHRACIYSCENRAGKVVRVSPIKHNKRDMTALDHTGANDIKNDIGTCTAPPHSNRGADKKNIILTGVTLQRRSAGHLVLMVVRQYKHTLAI